MEVLLCATNYDRVQAANALRRMLENRVQGVAVMTSQFDRELEAHLTEKQVPLVLLGSPPAQRYRSNIAINYRKGMAETMKYLDGLGHREIAMVTGPQDQVSVMAFIETAGAEMRSLGLKPFRMVEGDNRPESGARATRELLERRPRPTAILCGNDRMAIGALGTAENLGYRVPEDISIVGADDVWMTRYCHPPLTTIRIPRDVLGQLAFDVLSKMAQSKRRLGSEHVLETQLVIRGTTGKAASEELRMRPMTGTRVNA